MLSWIHEHETLTWWLAIISVVSFVGTLVLVPVVLVRLPRDYFAERRRGSTGLGMQHPVARILLGFSKNLIGFIFVLAGIVMLVIPGQGLLTIVVGLMLMNFPGKYAVEQWFVSRPRVLRTINWIRRRADKPPMSIDRR